MLLGELDKFGEDKKELAFIILAHRITHHERHNRQSQPVVIQLWIAMFGHADVAVARLGALNDIFQQQFFRDARGDFLALQHTWLEEKEIRKIVVKLS